jgi:hypothetical protein
MKPRREKRSATNSMPKIEVNKHINQLLDGEDQDMSGAEGANEDRNPGISQHVFPERAQIVGAFYQPEPETLEDDLARIIYVTIDLDDSLGLSAPRF